MYRPEAEITNQIKCLQVNNNLKM